MGVKGDNLELISGLLWSSFILNYMVIRVKGICRRKKIKKSREENELERENERRKQAN